MTDSSSPVIFLSGAGGGAPDLNAFRTGIDGITRFEVIRYPGWESFVADGFSAETLMADLVAQIETRVPRGPIRIVGLSIGGHLGYAAALRLQAKGREITGFCAIDTFMMTSSKPSAGWKGRALTQGLELLRARRYREFTRFARSKFWRGLVRLGGSRLPALLQRPFPLSRLLSISALDPVFEEEVNMRLLIEAVAPWIASLDRESVPLEAPTALLRTRMTANDDAAWRRRCPNIAIFEIPGQHHTLFDADNIGSLRAAFITATVDWR